MGSPSEEYRISVFYNQKRYAVLAHSVEQDESLYARKRLKKTAHGPCYDLKIDGKSIELGKKIESVGNQIHYHPSGMVKVKRDMKEISLPFLLPSFLELKAPLPILEFSPPDISSLPIDDNPKAKDFLVDISSSSFQRISFSIWIGPKGSFKAPPIQIGLIATLLFSETYYDILYVFRDLGGLPEELSKLSLTMFPLSEAKVRTEDDIPNESWVSAISLKRQIQTFMEDFFDYSGRYKLSFSEEAPLLLARVSYHIRISICSNGVVAAVCPTPSRSNEVASHEWLPFTTLSTHHVLEMLTRDRSFTDVSVYQTGLTPKTMLIRNSNAQEDNMGHEMIIVGNNFKRTAGHFEMPKEYLRAASVIYNGISKRFIRRNGTSK